MTTTHPTPSQGDERRALSILATFVHETWAGAYSWRELEHKARTALERAGLLSLQDVLALSAALAAPQPSQGANVKVGGSTVYVTNNHRRESNRWWATVYPGFDDDDKRVSVEECDAIARKIADALNAAPHHPVSAEPDRYKRALEAIIANPGGASAKRIATLALGLDGTEQASAEAGKGACDHSQKEIVSYWACVECGHVPAFDSVPASQQREPQEAAERPVSAYRREAVETIKALGYQWADGKWSAHQEASKPACDRCDGRRLVEEGDPESGGNKVPCPVCCGQEASKPVSVEVSDGDFARRAEQAGASMGWGDHGRPPQFPTWGAWGRFCDSVRAILALAGGERKSLPPACLTTTVSKEASKVEPVADEAVAWQERQQTKDGWTDWYNVKDPGFCEISGGIKYQWRSLYLRPTQQALSDAQLDELMPEPEEKGESWINEYGYECWDYLFSRDQVREAMREAILAAAGGSEK